MKEELKKLWITEEEAIIYVASLELGMSPASVIARRADIKRETCYYTLKKLISSWLMSTMIKNNVTYFIAENPEKLVQKANENVKVAKGILPELLSITNTFGSRPKVKFFEGAEGIKNVMNDIVTTKMEIFAYTNLWEIISNYSKDYWEYREKRKEFKIHSRTISTYSDEAHDFIKKELIKDLEQVLFVNKEEFVFENDVVIYWDKVAIISLDPDEGFWFIVESKNFAKTQKAIFDLAWLGGNMFIAH